MALLSYQLKLVGRFGRIFKNERLAKLGLNGREAEILLAVKNWPWRSQDEIAAELLIDKSGIARHLANLEDRGLVLRTVSPTDRRITQVSLSPEAEKLVEPIREINTAWSRFIGEALSPEENRLLHDALARAVQKGREELQGRKKP